MKLIKVAIVGTQGVPANYGGFESLVENIIPYFAVHPICLRLQPSTKGRH